MAYRSSRGANGGGYEANTYLEQQNDVMLDNLRDKIGNLKRVTIDIGEEARSQNRLLNDLGRDMDANQGLLGATMRKLGIVSRNKADRMESQKSPYVFHADSPSAQRVDSLKEAQRLMKTPEFMEKGARLIYSRSQVEADDYFTKIKGKTEFSAKQLEGASDGYKSPFPRLSTAMLNTMQAALKSQDLPKVKALMKENPNYLIDMSVDKPTILHRGTFRNAFHIAAHSGFQELIQYVMHLISDVDYLMKIYNFENPVSMAETSKMLREGFLNNPDKMGNIPAKLAAKSKHYQTAAYFTCFSDFIYRPLESLQLERNQFDSDFEFKRIMDLFRDPKDVYCVSLYFHEDRYDHPFSAVTHKHPLQSIQEVHSNFGHFRDHIYPKEVLFANEILDRPIVTSKFHELFYHLQAIIGVFSDMNEAVKICQKLNRQIKTYSKHEKNFSLTASEREELFICIAKKVAKDADCFAFTVEPKENPSNVTIEDLQLKLEELSTRIRDEVSSNHA